MSAGFTHLHVHTQYSLLDGAIRIADLLEKCKEYGMDSVAITDHGAMFGALEFYSKAKKAGIKPIVGCELYVAPGDMRERKAVDGQIAFHIVLLAMNHTGYQNLMKLASLAQFEGFYYKPRIDMQALQAHNEGIIAMTACLHGAVPFFIGKGDMSGAKQKAKELFDIFGDRLYFEIQENGLTEQQKVNEGLKSSAPRWASNWWQPTIVIISTAMRPMPMSCSCAFKREKPLMIRTASSFPPMSSISSLRKP